MNLSPAQVRLIMEAKVQGPRAHIAVTGPRFRTMQSLVDKGIISIAHTGREYYFIKVLDNETE